MHTCDMLCVERKSHNDNVGTNIKANIVAHGVNTLAVVVQEQDVKLTREPRGKRPLVLPWYFVSER